MSPDSPEEAARKAAERAARMAKFSAKAIDEEDEPVAVRSFNQARSGEDAGKTYSHKTGRVEDAAVTGSSLPRKSGSGPSRIDDDDLLAEIDAAVDAAEGTQPKLPDLNSDEDDDLLAEIDAAVKQTKEEGAPTPAPPGMNARRLAAMAAAAGEKADLPPAPPGGAGGPRLPKGLAAMARPSGDVDIRAPSTGPKLPKGLASLAAAGDVDIKPPAGSFAGMSGAGLGTRKKGPTDLSEDDLAGLRPKDGVKPSSAVAGTPAPAPRHSQQDDDDLLAEIDAAVQAAAQGESQEGGPGALKSDDGSLEDVADEGRKKEPATKYSGPAIHSPGDVGGFEAKVDKRTGAAAKPANPADDEFAVKSDKPKAAHMAPGADMKFAVKADKGHATGGDDFLSPGKFEAKIDKEERKAPKILSPADAEKFEVAMDKEEREAPKIRNPTETEQFEVAKDQSSGELAKNADAAVETPAAGVSFTRAQTHKGKDMPRMQNVGDHTPQAKRDAEAKPLPKMRSAGDEGANVRRDAETKPLPKMHSVGDDAVNARQDREHRDAPKFKGFNDAPVEAKHDREHRDGPKFKGFNDAPIEARQDRENRGGAPKIMSPADAEKYAVNLDRAARDSPMPRMTNPAEGGFTTKRDAQSHAAPKLRNATEGGFETKQDAQSKAPPKLRNPTEAEAFEAKQDAQRKALPHMRNVTDSAAIHARQDAQSKAPPKLRNPTEAESFETKRDAEAKPLPKLRNVTDAEPIQARRDAQAKPLPHMMSPADVDAYEARVAKESRGGIPSMRSPADAESYETKFAWRQKEVRGIRNAADDEATENKLDREQRAKANVSNPGQGEFDVKYEHESIWTTKPKRDRDDDTPATKKKSS